VTHELKTDKGPFQAVWDGRKLYEIRFNDRDFALGDELMLRETVHTGDEMSEGKPIQYTGRRIRCIVTHYLDDMYGVKDGWCILSVDLRARLDEMLATVQTWNGREWEEGDE
jgi:hypothetical protein